jgi:hypothetical protein
MGLVSRIVGNLFLPFCVAMFRSISVCVLTVVSNVNNVALSRVIIHHCIRLRTYWELYSMSRRKSQYWVGK